MACAAAKQLSEPRAVFDDKNAQRGDRTEQQTIVEDATFQVVAERVESRALVAATVACIMATEALHSGRCVVFDDYARTIRIKSHFPLGTFS